MSEFGSISASSSSTSLESSGSTGVMVCDDSLGARVIGKAAVVFESLIYDSGKHGGHVTMKQKDSLFSSS